MAAAVFPAEWCGPLTVPRRFAARARRALDQLRLVPATRPVSLPAVPPGMRVYAIGDVHGRGDLLDALLDAIRADIRERTPARSDLVILGDIVDRGPCSADVVERLRTLDWPAGEVRLLLGNHEQAMLDALDGTAADMRRWLRAGGAETLLSYGVSRRALDGGGSLIQEEMYERIPLSHIELLRGLRAYVRIGGYVFVHAGIRPGVALAEQSLADLCWIREGFLDDATDHGFVVVHGHTITGVPAERPNRLGIDTGAYHSGRLTALRLEGAERGWLWTDDSGYVHGTEAADERGSAATARMTV